MKNLYEAATNLFAYTSELRRDFHRHPELAFKEVRTAGIVARELREMGLEVTTGIAETGVVGLLETEKPGPTVLVRVDMDALPINEDTGAEYTSLTPGVMHACGHDGHVSIGLTVARILNDLRHEFSGRVKLIFQPAEEGMGGALRMMQDGVLQNPRPDACLSVHLWNELPVGNVAIVPGPLMAGAAFFSIHLIGKGGHGALPHSTIDPVVAAVQVVSALQTIVSRNVSPLKSAVVSITSIKAGEAFNIIPQMVEMRGTIRYFEPEIQKIVMERLEQIVQGVAGAMNCHAVIDMQRPAPAVINHPRLAERLKTMAEKSFPALTILSDFRTMVSEDMAEILNEIPGVYLMVGSANPEKGLVFGHHHPKFDFDERALVNAASLLAGAVLEFTKPGTS